MLNRQVAELGGDRSPAASTRFILRILQKSVYYKIQDCLLRRLNYKDLLALVVELDLQELKRLRDDKKHRLEAKRGHTIRDGTPEMATRMFR